MSDIDKTDYESQRLLDQYLLFHYGTPEQILEGSTVIDGENTPGLHFPANTVWSTLIFDLINEDEEGTLRGLDVGCAVGRSSLELSRMCSEVIGVDYSEAFIDAAEQIRSGQEVSLISYHEGHSGTETMVSGPAETNPDRVKFEVGDAMDLRDDMGQFDVVHAANLLCRLSDPSRFLDRLPELVKPGGQLLLATPCTWSEQFTPKENQPEESTLDFVRSHLEGSFELKRDMELPFLIREHARKYQMSTSQTTVWIRR